MSEINDSTLNRIRILAVFAVAVLAVISARLWLLQTVWGDEYKRLAEDNRIRKLSITAPRGLILDGNSRPLVKNRLSVVLKIEPEYTGDKRLIDRLAKTLGISRSEISQAIKSNKVSPVDAKIIKRDLAPDKVAYIKEHSQEFIGTKLDILPVREYPGGQLAAHVLGYLGELSEDEKKKQEFKRREFGDLVGKTGVEREYESVLSGNKGTDFVEVNAAGQAVRAIDRKEPDPGNNIVLTIDSKIQGSAEKALAETIRLAKKGKYNRASAGALLVMTPKGQVLAMASYPAYDPTVFVGGIESEKWTALNDDKNEYPLNNRAIMSAYPPGSTFKPVTATAGLRAGVMTTGTTVVCRGRWTGMGSKWLKWCWDRAGHGVQNLEGALRVSCDTFFYEIGYRLHRRDREELQQWAKNLGFGSPTGIDLPSETAGRVPTAAWKREFNKSWPVNQAWFPGDTVNLSIGQGDMLATPLQIANLYAAIANGGRFYRPHVVKAVIGIDGRKIYEVPDKELGALDLAPHEMQAMKRGLRRVVIDGTAAGAFAGFKVPVAGKTGTSEVINKDDFAFFAAYAPADDPRYVLVAVIEQGGHGGSAAAPAVRMVLNDIYGFEQTAVKANDRSR